MKPRKPSELVANGTDYHIWIWSELEQSWHRINNHAAVSFFKTWPDRYTCWLPDEAIKRPEAYL